MIECCPKVHSIPFIAPILVCLLQVDFHGLKWKLKDINVSTNMERLIRIIINLRHFGKSMADLVVKIRGLLSQIIIHNHSLHL